MAKKKTVSMEDLLQEAKELGIPVEEGDTATSLQEKIDLLKKGENFQPKNKVQVAPEVKETVQGLKRLKVTPEQLKKLQDEGRLYGWDPSKNEALVKE